MSRVPPTRLLLLVFLLVAGALIFALLHETGDGDSASDGARGGPLAATAPRLPAGAPALPAGGSPARPALLVEGGAELAPDEAAELAETDLVAGFVRGTLVDARGRPIAGEPVQLVLDDDPWDDGTLRERDLTPAERRVASGLSGSDGAFELSAQPGVEHVLHAGGRQWPRVALDAVGVGDGLLVTLPEGFVLQGTVRDAQTGLPIADAPVLVLGEETSRLGRSDAEGVFRLGPVPDAFLALGGWARGYDVALLTDLSPAADAPVLELPPGIDARLTLVDGDTGEPVAGAEVRFQLEVEAIAADAELPLPERLLVDEQVFRTGADGGFELAGVPRRGFLLRVSAAGYVPAEIDRYRERDLDPSRETVHELRPVPQLAGVVRVAEGGEPAAGARLALSGPQGAIGEAIAGEDGAFTLAMDGWNGKRPVHLAASDAAGRAARVALDRDRDFEDIVLELVEPLAITVQVLASGEPVSGAEVCVLSEGALPTRARTGEGGLVELVHALAGPEPTHARVQARFAGAMSLPQEVPLEPRPAEPVVVDVDEGAWVEGWVQDPAGLAVAAARIDLRAAQPGASRLRPTTRSDASGAFRLGPVERHLLWRLDAEAEGFHDARMHGVVAEEAPVAVTLQPVIRLRGRALDAVTGQPARGFGGGLRRETLTDGRAAWRLVHERLVMTPGDPGAFSIALPEAGRYDLRLFAKSFISTEPIVFDFDGRRALPEIELTLWPAALLELLVVDGRGRPVPGFEVVVIPAEAALGVEKPAGGVRRRGRTARTDGEGRAQLNLGEGGSYRAAGGPATWLDAQPFSVAPGAQVERTYRLPATGDLEVLATDAGGRPLAGVQVDVRSAKSEDAHSVSRRTALRAGQASVLVESLPPGEYMVTLRRRAYLTLQREVVVPGNAVQRLSVAMEVRPPQGVPTMPGNVIQGRR